MALTWRLHLRIVLQAARQRRLAPAGVALAQPLRRDRLLSQGASSLAAALASRYALCCRLLLLLLLWLLLLRLLLPLLLFLQHRLPLQGVEAAVALSRSG